VLDFGACARQSFRCENALTARLTQSETLRRLKRFHAVLTYHQLCTRLCQLDETSLIQKNAFLTKVGLFVTWHYEFPFSIIPRLGLLLKINFICFCLSTNMSI
jgi:hypothetical protein